MSTQGESLQGKNSFLQSRSLILKGTIFIKSNFCLKSSALFHFSFTVYTSYISDPFLCVTCGCSPAVLLKQAGLGQTLATFALHTLPLRFYRQPQVLQPVLYCRRICELGWQCTKVSELQHAVLKNNRNSDYHCPNQQCFQAIG